MFCSFRDNCPITENVQVLVFPYRISVLCFTFYLHDLSYCEGGGCKECIHVCQSTTCDQPSCLFQCISNMPPKPFRVSPIHLQSLSVYSDALRTELHHCAIPHCPLHMHCRWFVCLLPALMLLLLFVCLFVPFTFR